MIGCSIPSISVSAVLSFAGIAFPMEGGYTVSLNNSECSGAATDVNSFRRQGPH